MDQVIPEAIFADLWDVRRIGLLNNGCLHKLDVMDRRRKVMILKQFCVLGKE